LQQPGEDYPGAVPPSDFILRDGEDLVLDLHPHWWYFAGSFISAMIAILIGGAVLVKNWNGIVNVIAGLAIIGTLLWLAERYIRWVSTHFILTSDRIVWREGIVAKHGIEFPLQRINTIFFSQRMFERILGLGDLKIESASETGTQVFEDIKSPAKVQHEIYAQMEANENRGLNKLGDQISAAQHAPAAPPADAKPSVADQIADLHNLHEQGALTDAEFQAKKAELLGRM
jgi:uncharacterized membrane protein YdbT with pleckstrin-like domain